MWYIYHLCMESEVRESEDKDLKKIQFNSGYNH